MEKLPLTFKKDQFDYKQIMRDDEKALYAQGYASSDGKTFDIVAYEVIKIRQQKANTVSIGGVDVEFKEKELYPSSEQWGMFGWTFLKLENAKQRYDVI